MPCRSSVSYAFPNPQCPKFIFPICQIHFIHHPYSKHFIHAPLFTPTVLLTYCTYSSSSNSFNQPCTVELTNYTQQTNTTTRVTTFILVTFLFVHEHYTCPRQSIGTTPISKLTFKCLTRDSNTAVPPFFKHSTENTSKPGPYPISFYSLPRVLLLSIFALIFNLLNTGIRLSPNIFIFASLIPLSSLIKIKETQGISNYCHLAQASVLGGVRNVYGLRRYMHQHYWDLPLQASLLSAIVSSSINFTRFSFLITSYNKTFVPYLGVVLLLESQNSKIDFSSDRIFKKIMQYLKKNTQYLKKYS